jgi:DNA modification methylase
MKHPTQKPVSIMQKILSHHREVLVCDPFMGSGSTACACINLRLKWIGFELNEDYHQLISNRIKIFNSQTRLE